MAKATPELTFHASRYGPDFLVFVLEAVAPISVFVDLIPLDTVTIELHDFMRYTIPAQGLESISIAE